MYKVLLARHGESIWNYSSRFTGWTNIPLTNKGKKDALLIAKTLKNYNLNPTIYFTSVLERATDTANIIKNSFNSDLHTYTSWRLNEKHYGTLEGVPRDYVRKEYGNGFTTMLRSNYFTKPPVIPNKDQIKSAYPIFRNCYFDSIKNGESKEDVLNRCLPYFENDILYTLKDNNLPLVISHKHTIRVIMKHYLKMNDLEFESYQFPNKGIICMNFGKNMKYIDHSLIHV